MRLVSIELSDIRRFAKPVRIAPIGPGLNVLSAPNESGKSTVFDALQALFFQPHRSKGKEVMSLRPHVGGSPMVAVEIDLPEGRHRIEKRWLSKPAASVHRDGRLIAQADEAEAFLARLVQSGQDNGPAGLLWVRQGLTRLDSDNPRERDTAREARRSLLTSVTGEVEALTGGRRMDHAIARTREDLGQYVTAQTGKPAKGGPLAAALAEVEALTTRQAALQATAAQLDRALARRREVRRLLSDLAAPDAAAARQSRLAEAAQRHDAARRHADSLAAATAALQAADLQLATLTDRLTTLHRARAARDSALAAQTEAQARAATARSAATQAEAGLAPLRAACTAAQAARHAADLRHTDALRAEAARAAAARRADLTRRLTEARTLTDRRAALARAASTGPTAPDIAALDTLSQEVQVQRALRDRSAPHLTFHPDGPARALQDGTPIPNGPHPIHGETRFILPGFGALTVTPGAGADHSALDRAEAALTAALSRLGQPDIDRARSAAAGRAEAAAALADLDRALGNLAPNGLAALQTDLETLPAPPANHHDLPTLAEAQTAAEAAALAQTRAEAALAAAQQQATALREADIRAAMQAEAAETALMQATTALAALATSEADLTAALSTARTARDDHAATLARLTDAAPDLAAATAALARAQSIVEQARRDMQALETERAGLEAEIALRAGEGVMEELADTTARLQAAADRVALLQFEVATLQDLMQALETARNEARDRYFAPVLAELRPLLRVLWPDAELRFDGESLLPSALIRDGQEEDLSTLSGGTQEQVALLVRLAFARLLSRRGQHAPVIFDDALVYTDDDRIERIFDALHAEARDQQIIVLSCRQRVFRDLGGAALSFQPMP